MSREFLFTCPCCGYIVFRKPPGSFDFCPVCVWEDDNVQLRYVTSPGGANKESLLDSQKNYQVIGVSALRRSSRAASPDGFEKDLTWRPIDLEKDNVEPWDIPADQREKWPDDLTKLYYWADNYWRKK